MNDLNEQYKIELKLQEKKSNVRTLKSFLWFFIAMVVIWVLTAVDFFVIPLIVYIRGNLYDVRVKYMLLAVLCIVVGVRQDVSGTEMICHAVVRGK